MGGFLVAFAWLLSLGLGQGMTQEPAYGFGPLPLRNLQPLQVLFLQLPFEDPQPTPPGHWTVSFAIAEANTFNVRTSTEEDSAVVFDLELSRFALSARYGLLQRVEVGFELPFLLRWGGFLDGFIEGVEGAIGRLSAARDERPQNAVRFDLQRAGTVLFSRQDTAFGLSDVVLTAKTLLWPEDALLPAIAMRVLLKLPTGNAARLLGSGETDLGLGLSVRKTLGRFVLYSNVSYIIPTADLAETDLPTQNFLTAALGGEWRCTPRLSLLLQVGYYQSAFASVGVDELTADLWELALGFQVAVTTKLHWQFGVVENLVVQSGADFSLLSNVVYRF
jgi:hypothetical protein